uniref:Serpentine Receptor, class H n=2 Tax=Caenorhabditis tropicalis TaxID=1561998 RepID=A0A1I7T6H8_9PELO
MSTVKWYLFNLQFWIIAFDVSMGFLCIPFMLLPRMAGFPLGIAQYFGVPILFQTMMILIYLGFTLISIIAVFENRFNALCTFSFQQSWKFWRRPYLYAHYIGTAVIAVPFIFMVPEQSEAKKRTFQNLPCLPKYIYDAPVFVFSENYVYVVSSVVLFSFTMLGELIFFVTYLLTNTIHQMNSIRVSYRTAEIQKQLVNALIIQSFLPFTVLGLPMIYAWMSVMFDYYNQAYMNIALVICCTHGFCSTVVMICVHKPYRNELVRLLFSPKERYGPRRSDNVVDSS